MRTANVRHSEIPGGIAYSKKGASGSNSGGVPVRGLVAVGIALAALAGAARSAQAHGWCAFNPAQTSRMVCGYSSLDNCQKAASRSKRICTPNPFSARLNPRAPVKAKS